MPEYTYFCDKCKTKFSLSCSIHEYSEQIKCSSCKSKKDVHRCYSDDLSGLYSSIKKSDNELKTIGDIANRNRDKLSDDHKEALSIKHNKYKMEESTKELPSGMTRMKKQPKTKWS
jgi:hypothetical protein